MVAVFRRAAAAPSESSFQLTQAAGSGHPFAALLPGEASYRIPATNIPAGGAGCRNAQCNGDHARQRDRGDNVIEHVAKDPGGGGCPGTDRGCCLRPWNPYSKL
ncbi:hypothetical protein ARTHROSP310_39450 [Arthrobacter sp. AD-310]